MNKPTLIIHTLKNDLRESLRNAAKAKNIEEIKITTQADECVETLFKYPDALAFIDGNIEAEAINQILGATANKFKCENRPICLMVPTPDSNLIHAAYEYKVALTVSGALSYNDCVKALDDLEIAITEGQKIQEDLTKIAVAREGNQWEAATSILEKLHQQNPSNAMICCELAENHIAANQWKNAKDVVLPHTISKDPDLRALNILARCEMQDGNFSEAIANFEKANLLNPLNVERLIDLGHSFLNIDDVENAMASFDAALKVDKRNQKAKQGKGQALLQSGEVDAAIKLINSVSSPRELASIFNTAAIICIRNKKFPKGLQLYKSALAALEDQKPLLARIYFNVGIAFKKQSLEKRALACFKITLQLDPNFEKAKKFLSDKDLAETSQNTDVSALKDHAELFELETEIDAD